jgi:hypothetical protein
MLIVSRLLRRSRRGQGVSSVCGALTKFYKNGELFKDLGGAFRVGCKIGCRQINGSSLVISQARYVAFHKHIFPRSGFRRRISCTWP